MIKVLSRGLLDPDGVHTHTREDCPLVLRLHPGDLVWVFGNTHKIRDLQHASFKPLSTCPSIRQLSALSGPL
jgi:hypothetical protein